MISIKRHAAAFSVIRGGLECRDLRLHLLARLSHAIITASDDEPVVPVSGAGHGRVVDGAKESVAHVKTPSGRRDRPARQAPDQPLETWAAHCRAI